MRKITIDVTDAQYDRLEILARARNEFRKSVKIPIKWDVQKLIQNEIPQIITRISTMYVAELAELGDTEAFNHMSAIKRARERDARARNR